MLADRPKFWRVSILNPNFINFEETSSYLSVQFVQFFSSAFPWSPSISKPCSDILCQDYRIIQGFIGHHQQATYTTGIIGHDYGIIQGLPINHMRFADWVITWVVHLQESTNTGGPNNCIRPDCVCSAYSKAVLWIIKYIYRKYFL